MMSQNNEHYIITHERLHEFWYFAVYDVCRGILQGVAQILVRDGK